MTRIVATFQLRYDSAQIGESRVFVENCQKEEQSLEKQEGKRVETRLHIALRRPTGLVVTAFPPPPDAK